jgi:hypothetical protein
VASLPNPPDPTLEAIDRLLVSSFVQRHSRRLGASAIGKECERDLWYSFRWATERKMTASGVRAIEDGDRGETTMIERLSLFVSDTTAERELCFRDPRTGEQFEFEEIEGHFVAKVDGAICGLIQAPKRWHMWEHKVTNEKKFAAFEKAKRELGEKQALRAWDRVYYAQAIIGMHLMGLERHYLTVDTPGSRRTASCRTEEDLEEALRLLAKARRVIEAKHAPARISGSATFYVCRFCDHAEICHGSEFPLTSCRTCLHSTPIEGGNWHCARWGKTLTLAEQIDGCPAHLFIPTMINGEQTDAGDTWVEYRLKNGEVWTDGVRL